MGRSLSLRRPNRLSKFRATRLSLQCLEERAVPAMLLVDTPGDAGTGVGNAGDLRYIMNLATTNADADTITFAPSLSGTTITLTLGQLAKYVENQPLTITGPGAGMLTIDAFFSSRIFELNASGGNPTISISGLTLANGSVAGAGGAMLINNDPLFLDDITFRNNQTTGATNNGGAIQIGSTNTVTITNSKFMNNSAGNSGGCINSGSLNVVLNITGSTFSDNTATFQGGAINFDSSSSVTINSSTFTLNTGGGTSGGGGAINFGGSATLTVTNSTFTNNTSVGTGGGAAIRGGSTLTLDVSNSVFSGNINTASQASGGAIHSSSSSPSAIISDSVFTDNSTNGSGGALRFSSNSTVTLNRVLIANNQTTGSNSSTGGGIELTLGGSLTINDSAIVNNTALGGTGGGGRGGAINSSSAAITINNSTISGNKSIINYTTSGSAPGGGAIQVSSLGTIGAIIIRNSTISNNSATNAVGATTARGGALGIGTTSATPPSITIESSIIAGNHAAANDDIYVGQNAGVPRDITTNYSIVGVADPAMFNLVGTNIQSGDATTPFNPGLFALAQYGTTFAHALWYNSPAIDQGVANGLLVDQRGSNRTVDVPSVVNAFDGTDIGAFEGFLTIPFVRATTGIVNITSAGSSPYSFTVTYDDESGINTGKLGTGDIKVVGPGSTLITPTFKGSMSGGGNKVVATYEFNPVGGAWDPTDGGTYTISVVSGEVFDTDMPAQSVPAQTIGSFTVRIVGNLVVDALGDVDDGNYGPGNLTLREAIGLSNFADIGVDTITFAASTNNMPIVLGGSELTITDPLVIQGNGSAKTIISGNFQSRVFTFAIPLAGPEVPVSDLTLQQGRPSAGNGGAILLDDDSILLTHVVIDDNQTVAASTSGGAISATSGNIRVFDSTISNNVAKSSGGGINSSATSGTFTVEIVRSKILSNSAMGGNGGGINMPTSNNNSTLLLTDSTVDGNTSSATGGGLGLTVQKVTINGSTISNNTANGSSGGGGLNFNTNSSGVPLTIINSTISGNMANGSSSSTMGGGIRMGGSGILTLINSTVTNNTLNTVTGNGGGGIGAASGTSPTWNFSNSVISQNINGNHPDLWNAASSNTITINADFVFIGLNSTARINVAGASNQVGSGTSLDAKLDGLADNGGLTKTHIPLAGSPLIDQGLNSSTVSMDQRGLARTFDNVAIMNAVGGDGTDIGAVELQAAVAPTTATVKVNDGNAQRSMVTSLTITFSDPVTFPGGISNAIQVNRTGPGGPTGLVNLAFNTVGNTVTVTFDDPVFATPVGSAKSLIDGKYTITLVASQIMGPSGTLDGNGNGMTEGSPADDQVLNTHRLFGDGNGDGSVTAADFNAFRLVYGGSAGASGFDYDGDGMVSAADFNQFRTRYGITIVP